MKKVLTIGIDCRDLLKASTGTKTYLHELVEQFKQYPSSSIRFVFLHDPLPMLKGRSYFHKFLEHLFYFTWKQIILPVKALFNGCDIVFCTDYFLPIVRFGFKTVVVFHDAFFWEYPAHYNKIWLRLFHLIAVRGAKKSSRIIVPSNYSLSTISKYLQLPNERFSVVYEAGKNLVEKNAGKESELIKGLNGHPYFLHVGAFNKHKNLVRLIEAFEKVKQANPQQPVFLILAGQAGGSVFSDDSAAIKKSICNKGLADDVLLTGFVSDEDLSTLYQNSLAYVLPSYNEGFGLPALEAMAFQLPVIAANNTCLPEICKDGAIYFDPYDVDDIARQMSLLMLNEKERNQIKENQLPILASYSWSNAAKQIIAIFTEIETR
ncbi:MAG: glycosyltransferase family 1 protein [Chitinophagia bacterium]|nr:glycosyltransferase family 1 protein [Chitinophagia bacterium]